VLQGAPEVGYEAIQVVDGLDLRVVRTAKQDGQRTGKGFNVVGHIAKARPNVSGYA